MKLKIVILILASLMCLADAQAQRSRRIRSRIQPLTNGMANYIDSLAIYKARLDSMQSVNDSLMARKSASVNYQYYKLFSPLTFYPEVTGREMNSNIPDAKEIADGMIDDVLLRTYKTRPDLVTTTLDRLHRSAATGDDLAAQPVTNKVDVLNEVKHIEEALPMQEDVDIAVFKPNFWSFSGDYSLQFFQNFISDNWYKGGESNLSMVGSSTMKLNYNNKQKVKFENTLEMRLGLQTAQSDTLHSLKTSSDQLRYTGKLGLQATKKWYYTAQLIATTQFMRGYKSNDDKVYSDIFSPLEINISLGMDYSVQTKNKKLTGDIHMAPLAYNLKYVDRLSLSTRYGLEEGDHTLSDYGSQFTVNLTWKPSDMMKWTTRLYGYTTYKRAVVEWENTVSFTLSKYISTTLYFYPRFDDSAKRDPDLSYFQIKEYLSLGFSYSL